MLNTLFCLSALFQLGISAVLVSEMGLHFYGWREPGHHTKDRIDKYYAKTVASHKRNGIIAAGLLPVALATIWFNSRNGPARVGAKKA